MINGFKVTDELVLLLIKMAAQEHPGLLRADTDEIAKRVSVALHYAEGPRTKYTVERVTACVERWRQDGSLPPRVLN